MQPTPGALLNPRSKYPPLQSRRCGGLGIVGLRRCCRGKIAKFAVHPEACQTMNEG